MAPPRTSRPHPISASDEGRPGLSPVAGGDTVVGRVGRPLKSRVLAWLVEEPTVIFAILLNTVALFMLLYVEPGSGQYDLWFGVDYGCVIFFIVEASLKIYRDHFRGYWSSGWNRFDFAIVVVSLPVLATPIIDLHAFSGVLILRVGRLFRIFRLLRFIPDGQRMVAGIVRSLKASIGVFLALVLVNFILAMGACMLFRELSPEYFGDPVTSLYSMFQVFTVEGWYEIPNLLAERADGQAWATFARIYFVLSVLVGGILGLGLANAVFVDQMTVDNTDPLEARIDLLHEEMRRMREEMHALLSKRDGGEGEASE